ncbi:unnamed protein product [Bursaphelenchus okinawaensis]|uniref:Uncharacterized protein n=1 Tax=Bursaphelenchus okinawaensis TaxID=465554 RepID=A0A811JRD3_9BILA|nr:unnamed protein product [Bursaphelenchus okinawaensis]CAG9080039.1 unnamed protein product [Bursaphelenchus okinawaensis]
MSLGGAGSKTPKSKKKKALISPGQNTASTESARKVVSDSSARGDPKNPIGHGYRDSTIPRPKLPFRLKKLVRVHKEDTTTSEEDVKDQRELPSYVYVNSIKQYQAKLCADNNLAVARESGPNLLDETSKLPPKITYKHLLFLKPKDMTIQVNI